MRQLTAAWGIVAMPAPPRVRPALVQLGRMLSFDKILSGNRDISCLTCHLPAFAIGDGRSLSVGQGASGLGPQRTHPQNVFIPRNAPAAFNLHVMTALFWDGRIFSDRSGVHTPAGNKVTRAMARTFEFGSLSALPMFPVTSRSEMRGDRGNELAAIRDDDEPAIWNALMERLAAGAAWRAGDAGLALELGTRALETARAEGQDERRSGIVGMALLAMAHGELMQQDSSAAFLLLVRGREALEEGFGKGSAGALESDLFGR